MINYLCMLSKLTQFRVILICNCNYLLVNFCVKFWVILIRMRSVLFCCLFPSLRQNTFSINCVRSLKKFSIQTKQFSTKLILSCDFQNFHIHYIICGPYDILWTFFIYSFSKSDLKHIRKKNWKSCFYWKFVDNLYIQSLLLRIFQGWNLLRKSFPPLNFENFLMEKVCFKLINSKFFRGKINA